jgi:prepilin-type N-terminal cleavage/methylation domain-containing protein
MKDLKSQKIDSKGFTLVEIIVTIIAAGILGAIFVQLMGTALNSSWNAVEIVRDESGSEGMMEEIIADYVAAINSDPTGALANIQSKITNKDYGDNTTWTYIEFDASGAEIDRGASPTDNLKVVLQASGQVVPAIAGRYPMTIILTNSRRNTGDQVVVY